MRLSDFNYDLPLELIAQFPLDNRDESKLLIYKNHEISESTFNQIVNFFEKDDVLVLNESKVIKSKLIGKKESGGFAQITLTKRINTLEYYCYVKTKNPKINTKIIFNYNNLDESCNSKKINETTNNLFPKSLFCIITEINDFQFKIKFNSIPDDFIELFGDVTIPPYVKNSIPEDKYQTIYAKEKGSIAAPTAGFHFTKNLLEKLKDKGVIITTICLHVGVGTFAPVKTENIEEHKMHEEFFTISDNTADIINSRKKRLFLVGTTTLRALESSCNDIGKIIPTSHNTNIFIYPGYNFKLNFDALITNFHLPKSTLLMLISTIITRKEVFKIYDFAISKKYRFFSFGDACLIFR